MLSDISSSISACDVNIAKAEMHADDVESAIGNFDVIISNLSQLENVMKSIISSPGRAEQQLANLIITSTQKILLSSLRGS